MEQFDHILDTLIITRTGYFEANVCKHFSQHITGLLMCAGILVPSDEFRYWGEAARMSTKMNMKERARGFMELFQPISKDFGNMSTLSMPECIELVEMTQDTLDEVWKQTEHDPPYPEPRMLHLMDIIGRWCRVHLMYNCGFFCLYTSRFIS